MNNIRATKAINEKELALGIQASWHDDYKDSAYIYIGGLDTGLTEGDVITIFSQYGEPVDINMPKAKPEQTKNESGNPEESKPPMKTKAGPVKSRGFCFLMYENQLSTNLAVDNLNGAIVLGRTLRVDHCKNYKQLERTSEGKMTERDADLGERLNALPELHINQDKEENQSDESNEIDPEDPMASYLLEERKKRKKKESKKKHRDPDEKRERKKSKRGEEADDADRRARKDAKRIKKLLKEIGPSDRADESNSRSKEDRRRNYDDDRDSFDRRRSYSPAPRDSRDRYDRNDTQDDRRDDRRSYKRETDSHHVSRSTNDDRYGKDSSHRSKPSYHDDDDSRRR